jgi:hypothetical protein
MELRFHLDPETGQPHVYEHGVREEEVHEVMSRRGEDYPAANDTRRKLGQTCAGRYLQVIYVPDKGADSMYVITAYELSAKAQKAYRRRQRRRRR